MTMISPDKVELCSSHKERRCYNVMSRLVVLGTSHSMIIQCLLIMINILKSFGHKTRNGCCSWMCLRSYKTDWDLIDKVFDIEFKPRSRVYIIIILIRNRGSDTRGTISTICLLLNFIILFVFWWHKQNSRLLADAGRARLQDKINY